MAARSKRSSPAPTTRATATRSSKARLPVKNYSAKLWVEPDDRDPARTVIHWDATFDANGKSDEEAEKVIGDIFYAGLKNIKHMVDAA